MPVFRLNERLLFPPPDLADESGLLAVGGDLRPDRLLLAYSHGIFPWYEDGYPILWHSPDPRMVLTVGNHHLPRSLKKTLRRGVFEIRWDTSFERVVSACAETRRPRQRGTWITDEMKRAYVELHGLGYAHSVEAWKNGALVGGLYGVSLGAAFFGESMFAHAADASKVAFAALIDRLSSWNIHLIDCQIYTDHLSRFGAEEWPRRRFLDALATALTAPTRRGNWGQSGTLFDL